MKRPGRMLGAGNGAILSNAGALLSSMIVTSALGLVYWLVAKRLFAVEESGFALANVQMMQLLGNAGMLGLGTLLINELPRRRTAPSALITMALLVSGVVGSVLGVLFAVVAPLIAPNLAPLAASVTSVALFAAGVSLTAITLVLDQALIGLLRGGAQLGRNTLFAVIKLVVLLAVGVWLPGGDWLTIYATWMVGNVASLVLLFAFIRWRQGNHQSMRPQLNWALVHQFKHAAWGHHWLNLALQVPGFAMPTIAAALLSRTVSAYFGTATLLVGLVFFAPFAIATALYASGAHAPSAFVQRMRFTLKLSFGLGVLANIVMFVGADLILGVFSAEHAAQAGWVLRLLGLGVFPIIIKDHYVTICRLQQRLGGTALLAGAGSVLELVLAAVGAGVGGVLGLTLGWLAALYIQGIVLAPYVYRTASNPPTSGEHQSGTPTSVGSETSVAA